MTRLLGGGADPLGWSMQFVDAPMETTLAALVAWRRELGRVRVLPPRPYPAVLGALLPLEAEWSRELLFGCGSWTACLNNGLDGGDPSASASVVARELNVRHVVAMHTPMHGPGHAATQLWVSGPGGEPPLMYVRTLAAVAADGRWGWDTFGEPFPFEDTARYDARRLRDRFDRPLLLRYLHELGIPVTDEAAYGDGVLVQQLGTRSSRTQTLDEARRDLGLDAR